MDNPTTPPPFDWTWLDRLQCSGQDVLVYCGRITTDSAAQVISMVEAWQAREKLVFVLGTNGGNPDAAYRIMRCLQQKYRNEITMLVPSYCKSAGTLLAIGANTLVMLDSAELGPLDMQVGKHDEFGDLTTSLMPRIAIDMLTVSVLQAFEKQFASLRHDTGYKLTSRTCADIAARLTVGCFGPIFKQIDPMRLAEMTRELQVAHNYGIRLDRGNLKPNALDLLVSGFASHEFVIDRTEAERYFQRVRSPSDDEKTLGKLVVSAFGAKMSELEGVIQFIEKPAIPSSGEERENDADVKVQGNAAPAGTSPARVSGDSGPPLEHREPKPSAGPTKVTGATPDRSKAHNTTSSAARV